MMSKLDTAEQIQDMDEIAAGYAASLPGTFRMPDSTGTEDIDESEGVSLSGYCDRIFSVIGATN